MDCMAVHFVVLHVCADCASGCVLGAKEGSSPGCDVGSDHGYGDRPPGHDHESYRAHLHARVARHENRVDLAHDLGSRYGRTAYPPERQNVQLGVAAKKNATALARESWLGEDLRLGVVSVLKGVSANHWQVWQ